MTEPEDLDDDLFADLYDADEPAQKQEAAAQNDLGPVPQQASTQLEATAPVDQDITNTTTLEEPSISHTTDNEAPNEWSSHEINGHTAYGQDQQMQEEPKPIGIKEDGKMFIGGLNWETTDQSLKDYFSKFGEVQECTVMRDGATGRSRGFGFLTFKDPKTVNVVMVKEHYLDGKIIDPKRAIPRDEQERTSKIFVGGVSQEANETIFKEYFAQYGRVVDATLMMDKDTGRPRGFGFVTFDSEAAVENTLNGDLTILGKPIEVKKAQPRGDMQEGESLGRGGRGGRGGRRGWDDRYNDNMNGNQSGNMMQGNGFGGQNGMTPQMMAQYWQKMQQYFAAMQQQMAMAQGMGGMNPAMMQQMQQMQQMKAMQMAQGTQQNQGRGSASPMPQGAGDGQNMMQGMQGMNPQMMQQMQAMMQQQMQGGRTDTPTGFNAAEQQAFEQRKYEQQAGQPQGSNYGAPTSWEGMYDDVPAPDGGQGGGYGGHGGGYGHGGYRGRGRGRGGFVGGQGGEAKSLTPQSAPPANAPTGPKNAGRPGANYRGGGRGGHRGFHPYAR